MNEYLTWSAVAALLTFTAQQVVKTWFDIKTNRSKVVFTQLHQERFEVIKILYSKIVVLKSNLDVFVNVSSKYEREIFFQRGLNDNDRVMDLNSSISDAYNYYKNNKIYFSRNICLKIESALDQMTIVGKNIHKIEFKEGNFIICNDHLGPYLKNYQNEIPSLLSDIEKEFSILLGLK